MTNQYRIGIALLTLCLASCDDGSASTRTVRDVAPQQSGTSAGAGVKVAEATAMKVAKQKPYPAYPATALKAQKEGQVIASIATDPTGQVRDVTVLETSSEEFRQPAVEALRQWQLNPLRAGGPDAPPSPVSATLTFYFRIVDGKGVVKTATDLAAEKAKKH